MSAKFIRRFRGHAPLASIIFLSLALAGCSESRGSDAFEQSEQSPARFVEINSIMAEGLPNQNVTIWLPPGYDDADNEQRYGVVYMQDGQHLFDRIRADNSDSWAADAAMLDYQQRSGEAAWIIVAIASPGKDRYRQYLPQAIARMAPPALKQQIEKQAGGEISSDAYLKFITTQLKPMVDRDYRTQSGPAHSAIIGASMGGLISCYAFAQQPEVFGRAACVSAHWPLVSLDDHEQPDISVPELWSRYFKAHIGKPDQPEKRRLWMDHGTVEQDADYAPYQQAVDAALSQQGWVKGRDFQSKVYQGAAHDEKAWAARLDEIFDFLLSESEESK